MAMAGGFHHHHHNGKGGNAGGHRDRGRAYGLMLLLAFAAALLGVMALHKLRERRIQNIILKDKDRELFSLHLLLQKEKDNTKETTRKAEEMRAKIYLLRTEKMELDSRVLEMQSTISSLKDEQRTMELALEEKQEEIKALREKEMETSKGQGGLQESSLREILNQKELEIADLKRKVESLNTSTRGSEMQKEEGHKLEERGESGVRHESTENAAVARGADESVTKPGVSDGTIFAEKMKLRDDGNVTGEGLVQEEVTGEKGNDESLGVSRDGSAGSRDEQNPAKHGISNDSNVITTGDGAAREVSTVIEGKADPKELEEGDKSEQLRNGRGHSGSTVQRKLIDGNGSRSKGKRWRALARKRRSESNGSSGMIRHRRFIGDAAQLIEAKQLEVNTAKEQDQDLNVKNGNESDQSGGVEKVSEDFNGDDLVRKGDSDPDRLESGGKDEDSPQEERVRVESAGKGEESSGEDRDRLESGGKRDEILKKDPDRLESEGRGKGSPKEDENRFEGEERREERLKEDQDRLESGGRGEESPKDDQDRPESGGRGKVSPKEENEHQTSNPSDQLSLSGEVSMKIDSESEAGNPTDGGENGVVKGDAREEGNQEGDAREEGNQEGDASAESISKDTDSEEAGASEEEVPNNAEEATRESDVEDSPELGTGRDFVEKDASKADEGR